MRVAIIVAGIACLIAGNALAQSASVAESAVYAECGQAAYSAVTPPLIRPQVQDTTGAQCDSGSGAAPSHVLSAASTNSTSVKASAGIIYGLTAVNTNATTAYLKLYNIATAPTCNSSAVAYTVPLPQNAVVNITPVGGIYFSTGIGLCITGGIADTDNTNATTGIAVSMVTK